MDYRKPLKTNIAFWVWRNLAGGKMPFYENHRLLRHKTFIPPQNRFKRWLWNKAVAYLLTDGQLTQTPALREKF